MTLRGWDDLTNGWAAATPAAHAADTNNPHQVSVSQLRGATLGQAYYSVRVNATGDAVEIALLNTNSLRTDANLAITQLAGGGVGNLALGGATGAANSWGKATPTHISPGAALTFLRTNSGASAAEWASLNASDLLPVIGAVMLDPTGFPLPGAEGDTTCSFVSVLRQFTISPTGASFSFYVAGTLHTKSVAQSVVIPDVYGAHVIYFDTSGTLQSTQSAATVRGLIRDGTGALVYIVLWNSTLATAIVTCDERHGCRYPGAVHEAQHNTDGAKWSSGGELQNLTVDGDGSLATHAEFSVEALVYYDEDIRHRTADTPQVLSLPAQVPVLYQYGASGEMRVKAADAYPLIYSGTAGYTGANGRVPYNQWTGATWQLTEVSQGAFVLMHYFGVGSTAAKVVGVQGRAEYSTLTAARAGAEVEINAAKTTLQTLIAEAVPLGTVIVQTASTYGNTPKARFRSDASGASYVDFRQRRLVGASTTSTGTTFADSAFVLYDEADTTKRVVFQLSGVGTGTTRTLTMPNVDVDLGAIPPTILSAGGANTVIQGAATAGAQSWTSAPSVASLTATTYLAAGAGAQASSGSVRLPATSTVRVRNAANDADVTVVETQSSTGTVIVGSSVTMGGTTNDLYLRTYGGNIVSRIDGASRHVCSTSAFYPATSGGLTLGSVTLPWGTYYGNATILGDNTPHNYWFVDELSAGITANAINLVGVGKNALASVTDATESVAVGLNAGFSQTTASYCVSIGSQANYTNSTSNYRVAVGSGALRYGTGAYNTGVGGQAGRGATGGASGEYSWYGGYQAGLLVTSAADCTITGAQAGDAVTTATGATFYGRNAGGAHTTAANRTCVGNGAGATGNWANSTEIGAGAQASADNQVWLGNADANVYTCNIYPKTHDTYDLGSAALSWDDIYATNTTIQVSDARLKEAFRGIPEALLDRWGDVPIQQWRWRASVAEKGDAARYHTSPVAQDVLSAVEGAGLTSADMGLVVHNAWPNQWEDVWVDVEVDDEEGGKRLEKVYSTSKLVRPAGDAWALRGEQCLWVEAAYHRRQVSLLESRLALLERPWYVRLWAWMRGKP